MTNSLDTTRVYRFANKLQIKDVGDGLVVFDPESLTVHELDEVLTLVARMCDGSHSCEDMVTLLADQNELAIQPAAHQVYCALKVLFQQGLVEAA